MSRLERWWAGIPESRKKELADAITQEKTKAAAWLKKHEPMLPHETDGRDSRVGLYQFTLMHTDELGDRLDDRDGIEFAGETYRDIVEHPVAGSLGDEEKARAYLGLESTLEKVSESAGDYHSLLQSSGPLGSSWRLVEKSLGNFYYGGCDDLKPDQFVRLERSKTQPRRKQWRNGRVNPLLRKVWDSAEGRLVEEKIAKFYPTRVTTRMAWDADARIFREIPFTEFNPHDPEGLESVRRAIAKKSPQRVGSLPDPNELAPAKPISVPVGPMREWDGDESVPVYRDWLESGDYEALRQFRQRLGARGKIA
jgi:hypothetical protein